MIVTVCGIGPAGAGLVTAQTGDAIAAHEHRYLRTAVHPSAGVMGDVTTFDDVYESEATFDDVYREIVERLVAAAAEHGEILYAVPGSPRVLERSVDLLTADERVETRVLPAMSFLDLAWARLGVDPIERGVRLVDAHVAARSVAGAAGALLVAHTHSRPVMSNLKLSLDADDTPAVILHHLGLPDEQIIETTIAELDRSIEPDHLTAVWLPSVTEPVGAAFAGLADLVTTLRAECPWDREQTHLSLRHHLLEETYEVLEAIDAVDAEEPLTYGHLEEELGDLLYQVFFHAELATEEGQFDVADVARGIHHKLYTRHPHVFGGVDAPDVDTVFANWEQLKKSEKGRESVFDGVPGALPALLYTTKILKKAVGVAPELVPADPTGALTRLRGAVKSLAAVPDETALGEVLVAAVALARLVDVDPESALRTAADRLRSEAREREASSEAASQL
ncbi:MAG: MazG family protein [Acidimicrobiales bacterium]